MSAYRLVSRRLTDQLRCRLVSACLYCRLIVTTLVLEYVLANAAVARSFSAYFAALCGQNPDFFTFPYKDYTVDFMAAGIMVLCCLLLMFSTAGGSWFNIVVTGTQLLVILIILIAGFVKANPANLKPFMPFGAAGAHLQSVAFMEPP